MRLSPQLDKLCIISVKGSDLLEALENGVSMVPKAEGRFPLVAGISFTFDVAQPAGARVLRDTVRVCGAPLDLDREYAMATKRIFSREKMGT